MHARRANPLWLATGGVPTGHLQGTPYVRGLLGVCRS
jgi:hypothetical protein